MADAVVSGLIGRIIGLLAEQARQHIDLVRGAEAEVRSLAQELNNVRMILEDAERRGIEDKSIKYWLARLEDASYEMEDVLDEWEYEIRKLQIEDHGTEGDDVADFAAAASKQKVWSCTPSSPCLCFKKVDARHHVAKRILVVKAQFDKILSDKVTRSFVMSQPKTDSSGGSWRLQSDSSVILENVYGRDSDRDNVVSLLMVSGDSNIVSVVGVGGLGKTTISQLVYDDSRVKERFELRIWVCVSDPFDVIGIAKRIVESVKDKENPPNTDQYEVALRRLREAISGKKFLLVLDDVWNHDSAKWERLRINLSYGGEGSKILVTTRNKEVATTMGTFEDNIYCPQGLSLEDCWSLLRRIAHLVRRDEDCEEFEEVGKEIARKCNGLPLAAAVLGGLLQSKNTLKEWEFVLDSEIWKLEKVEDQLFSHLRLTYNELSPALKRCFSYCGVFPKDSEIDVDELVQHWIAQGYLGNEGELKGFEYFKKLAMHSLLIRTYEEFCKMHDIIHDFTQSLKKDRSSVREEATCQRCSSLLVPNAKTYRTLLFENLDEIHICDCFTSLRVLSMRNCDLGRFLLGTKPLIHLRGLKLHNCIVSNEVVKAICKLYNMQFLVLRYCKLEEVPREIGNLIKMRYLDLRGNSGLRELPESICGLHELQALNISSCESLSVLPEGINKLINLKQIINYDCHKLRFSQGLAELTSLEVLPVVIGGGRRGEFGILKNLKKLRGELSLLIEWSDDSIDMVEDVRKSDLRNKMHLRTLRILFGHNRYGENGGVRMYDDVLDALEAHQNLHHLEIDRYAGFKLEGWITSPLCHLRSIKLCYFTYMEPLPPLGRLPCLEEVQIEMMNGLKFVGREFLGLTGDGMGVQSSSNTIIGFPKLKKLKFGYCYEWEEWEDITVEEEDSDSVTLMPCLEKLVISGCRCLPVLPHRLLSKKALSLEYVAISNSYKLVENYANMEGAAWDHNRFTLKVPLRPQ